VDTQRTKIKRGSVNYLCDITGARADQVKVAKLPQVIGMVNKKSLIPDDRIEKVILLIRGQKVMLDADLAELYGVETRVLVQAVKRNLERFPEDFMFQLSQEEFAILRSQIVTLNKRRGDLAVTRRQSLSQVVVTIIQNPIASRKSSEF
jgi:hypothetical protein